MRRLEGHQEGFRGLNKGMNFLQYAKDDFFFAPVSPDELKQLHLAAQYKVDVSNVLKQVVADATSFPDILEPAGVINWFFPHYNRLVKLTEDYKELQLGVS